MPKEQDVIQQRLADIKALELNLDMSRGQPSPEQFDLSLDMLCSVDATSFTSRDGLDCRNYPGGVAGLPEAREYFSEILEVPAAQTIVGNNASIEIMQNILMWALLRGLPGSSAAWGSQQPKFLCPAPGYDRHFTMLEALGIEMLSVPMTEEGPDMEVVQRLVAQDDSIKGIWCVPKYSNPTGITYSDAVVDALAGMKTAAEDFRIFWDNAYAVHHLVDSPKPLKNLYAACEAAGNPNRAYIFSSTSKVTFSGGGVGFMGASKENFEHLVSLFSTQTIGPDKLNQLRHVRFLENYPGGLDALMKAHAEILKPKFAVVEEVFQKELGGLDLASWSKPEGGYFINFDTQAGQAKKVVQMASDLGLNLTGAGATFPYKKDPEDKNIRIAPTRPAVEEVRRAAEIVSLCVRSLANNA